MSGHASALAGSTALVVLLVGALAFAVLKFMTAARSVKHQGRSGGAETALLSSALHDAVSTLKAREQAMSARAVASEALSAQVFDSLAAGLIVIDPEGRVTNVNPAARRFLSIAAGSGVQYGELLAAAPAVRDAIADGLAAHTPVVRRAVHVEDRDRSWHFDVTVSPFGGPGDTSHGAICLLSDLTAVVDLEQQLQQKDALARLGELTAGIAHEFRNGLATIHGYSRLIDPSTLPPAYKTCIEGIRSETETLGHVVTNFLNFARPESISLLPVDLAAVVQGAAADLRPELPPATTVAVTGAFGVVPGDEVLLRQAFDNLIRNAAEACASVGTAPSVTIDGHVDTAKQLAIVSVEDNGPGIPEANRNRVFQPFFTTRSRGSGLGLSIVQKIILLHNGKILVGSAARGGARMQVLLPLTHS